MRNITRISLALLLCVLMLMQSVAVFAEVSPIVYEVNEDGSITSYVYARNLKNGANLYTAVYNADGSLAYAKAGNKADKAGYLKTTVTKEEGQTVKSFLWDKTNAPFAKEGEYDDAINIDDVAVTVNNVELREYLSDEDTFAFGETYNIDIKDAGFDAVPVVRAASKDSQVSAFVDYSADYSTATVTFKKGARILSDDAKTITNNAGKSFVAERYTNEVVETITVKFVKTYLSDSDLTSGSVCGQIVTDSNLGTLHKKEYKLSEGESVKKISLLLPSTGTQGLFVALRPLDASNGKDTLVNADGSAISWLDDNGSVFTGYTAKKYNYTTNKVEEYGKITKSYPITNGTIVAAALKEISYGDGKKQTRARGLTDRTPLYAMAIRGFDGSATSTVAKALEGCNYFVFESAAKTNVTLEFYVNKDVEVNIYSTISSNIQVFDIDGETTTEWPASCKSSAIANRQYENSVDAISVAWLIKEGIIEPADVVWQKNQNAYYDINGDGKKQNDELLSTLYAAGAYPGIVTGNALSAYYVIGYSAIDYLVAAAGATSGWGFDNHKTKKDIPNSILPYYYSDKYTYEDYLAIWDDRDYNTEIADLVTDFNHISTATVEDMPMVVVSAGAHKGDTATYTGDIVINSGIQSKVIDFFGLTLTPDRTGLQLNADGTALNNQNATGALMSYPDGFGLEDATYICFNNGPINDDGFWFGKDTEKWYPNKLASYADYWNATDVSRPWYSFKVARDAEVMVFSTGMLKFLEDENSGFEKIGLPTADGFKVMRQLGSSDYNCSIVYTKTFKAGETVEMKTPGYQNVLYGVFVKEAQNPEVDTNLKSITINGVALDGFDPEVTEYTYALSEEEACSATAPVVVAETNSGAATVKVLKPETFPGSTKIIVNHVNGGTKVYTINYTENYTYVTNVSSDLTTVTTSPKFYKNGLVVGLNGILATDRSGSTSWRISEVNVPELVGNDTIIGAVDALKGATVINFTLKRPATVRVLLNANGAPNQEAPLVSYGFVLNPDVTSHKIVGTVAGTSNIRYYPRMLTMTLDAGTYSIPYVRPDMPGVYAFDYLPFK